MTDTASTYLQFNEASNGSYATLGKERVVLAGLGRGLGELAASRIVYFAQLAHCGDEQSARTMAAEATSHFAATNTTTFAEGYAARPADRNIIVRLEQSSHSAAHVDVIASVSNRYEDDIEHGGAVLQGAVNRAIESLELAELP